MKDVITINTSKLPNNMSFKNIKVQINYIFDEILISYFINNNEFFINKFCNFDK